MAVTYSQNGVIVRQTLPTDAVTTHRIDSEQGINVVDENGYIGAVVTDYFPHAENTYFNNFAIVVNNADFSQSGLGRVTFITPGTTNIGGRTYRTVNIGGVEWLAENLDYKFSGCAIGPTSSSNIKDPAAWYYHNDESTYGWNGYKCGLMYNWYAVNLLETNKATLCPGWHVPTSTEYDALITVIGGSSTAGTKMKALDGSAGTNWPSGWNGTDDYEFKLLPGGDTPGTGKVFYRIGTVGRLWTANNISTTDSGAYRFLNTETRAYYFGQPKTNAFSLRLVRDAS